MNLFLTANMKTKEEFFDIYEKKLLNEEYDGKTLLQYAMGNVEANERYAIVNFLLDQDVNVEVVDQRKQSLLHVLCCHIEHDIKKTAALIQRLIDLGVDINALDNKNRLALHHIVNFNKYSDDEMKPIYDVLFSQPALDVDTKNVWGYSPLELAQKEGEKNELIKGLLKFSKFNKENIE